MSKNWKVSRMAVKLFILGLPGSGKSTISRYILSYAGDRLWSTAHINDFAILYEMFKEDTQGQFKSTAYGGFDILDFTVLDTALGELEQKVRAHITSAKLEEIVLIEFSRNDYEKALQQFSQEFLQDAYFLYLSVDLEICKRRIRERVAKPNTVDDFFVSEYIFDAYYNGDNGKDLPQILKRNYGIDRLKTRVINNSGSQEDFSTLINEFVEIKQFVDTVIAFEAHRLPDTEPMQKIKDAEVGSELERNR
jgi:adenylate kinase family enzyme